MIFRDSLVIDTIPFIILSKKLKKSIDKAICCMIYLLSNRDGVLAQLGEHLLCTQGVSGSIPIRSTMIDQKRFLTESFFVLCLNGIKK